MVIVIGWRWHYHTVLSKRQKSPQWSWNADWEKRACHYCMIVGHAEIDVKLCHKTWIRGFLKYFSSLHFPDWTALISFDRNRWKWIFKTILHPIFYQNESFHYLEFLIKDRNWFTWTVPFSPQIIVFIITAPHPPLVFLTFAFHTAPIFNLSTRQHF